MSQTLNTLDTLPCNTNIRGKVWGPCTWNNYSEENLQYLINYFNGANCEYFINQEIGENGTPHLQFCMRYENARTFKQIKDKIPKAHIEKARNWKAVEKYCCKDSTAIAENINNKIKLKDIIAEKGPREWQQTIIDMCEEEPDDRSINWIFDEIGNHGKTKLAKHLCIKYPKKVLYLQGKASDIKYGVTSFLKNNPNGLKIAIFGIPRTSEKYVSYDAIESIKDGIFFNGKYESAMTLFDPPHIFVFANFYPEIEKLSTDRWNIMKLDNGIFSKA